DTKLTAALFYKDNALTNDTADSAETTATNKGLKKRAEFIKGSKPVDMMGNLHLDLMHMERYLLNNINMKITLNHTKPEFCLMAPATGTTSYIIKFEEATLFLRKVRVAPGVLLGHEHALTKATAKYPHRNVEVTSFTIPANALNITRDSLFQGRIPQELIVG